LSRARIIALVLATMVVLVGAGFGIHALQVSSRERAKAAAIRRYTDRVGPGAKRLYASWSVFQKSIGRPEGSDELAVKASYDEAKKLGEVLDKINAPADARLFHHEMTDIVSNILVVIDARVRLAITGPEPDESGVIRDPEEQKRKIQRDAGNAFYIVKTTFPDAMTQLRALEAAAK
jgi:hypothetical protein